MVMEMGVGGTTQDQAIGSIVTHHRVSVPDGFSQCKVLRL